MEYNKVWHQSILFNRIVNGTTTIIMFVIFIFILLSMTSFFMKLMSADAIQLSAPAESAATRACEHFYPGSKPNGGFFGVRNCWIESEAGSKKVGEVQYVVNNEDLAKGKAAVQAIWDDPWYPLNLLKEKK